MDLADYLKLSIKDIHKCPLTKRVDVSREARQTHRTKLLLGKRNIKNISLLENSPFKMEPRNPTKPSRTELLKKWKEDRDRAKAANKVKAKPLFKVSSTINKMSLDEVYSQIKGKPINRNISSMTSTVSVTHITHKLVESTHKFKAPANIKSIQFAKSNKLIASTPIKTTRRQIKFDKEDPVKFAIASTPIKSTHRQVKFDKEVPIKSAKTIGSAIEKDSKFKITNTRELRSRTVACPAAMKASQKNPKSVVGKVVKRKDDAEDVNKLNQRKKITASRKNVKGTEINVQTELVKPSKSGNSSFDMSNKVKQKNSSIIDLTSPNVSSRRVTRQTKININKIEENDHYEIEMANVHPTIEESLLSPTYPIENVIDSQLNTSVPNEVVINTETTPNMKQNVTVYVSPFVTMSRGKSSARKEFKSRHSKGGLDINSPETTGTKAAATYFYQVLDNEIDRIEKLCEEWNKYKNDESIPEEACDMINTATGQSQLLINKRMKQFRGLIGSCEAQDSTPLITSQDLHGYWDLILIQAQNLNSRFENLVKLRANNWEEIIPQKKKPVASKAKKSAPKKVTQSSSSIRDAIKAAKLRAKNKNSLEVPDDVKVFDAGFFNVTSPNKSTILKKTPKKGRKSLLQSVLSSEAKRVITSPGLAMVKVSQVAKGVDIVDCVVGQTPGKSILRQENVKSSRKSKAVLFNDDINESKVIEPSISFDDENDSNILNTDIVQEGTKISRRRWSRRSKLFQ